MTTGNKRNGLLYIILLILVFYPQLCFDQVYINEVLPANLNGITDEDTDFEDWIEIVNHDTSVINLAGYGLSDRRNEIKWVFP
ncbi:MAG: hypothetical protein GVY19_08180 [Bacteroidetes bacterium]|jgi:hypothetical protein|nr:hypothetical protein [Bacteroidota bacterium]